MKNILLIIGLGLLAFSCNSTKQANQRKTTTDSLKIMIPKSNCFNSVIGKDTIWLKLEVFPNVVTGILKYEFSEKDNNIGTIEGKLEGNKIFADYTFISEGKESVRSVAFLLNGDTVIEGFGEMIEVDGKLTFKNKDEIDFSKGIEFNPIDCVEYHDKFSIK